MLPIERFRGNFLSTIVVYLYQLIQAIRGRNWLLCGQQNIFYKPRGPLQLARRNYWSEDVVRMATSCSPRRNLTTSTTKNKGTFIPVYALLVKKRSIYLGNSFIPLTWTTIHIITSNHYLSISSSFSIL